MKKLSYWVALLGLLPMAVLLGQPLKKQTTTMKQAPQPTQQQVQKTSQPQAPQQAAQTEISEKEELQKLSEAFGHFIGSNLSRPGIEFDIESMIKGIRDGAAGKPGPLPEKDYQTLLMKYQEKGFKKVSEQNLNAANNFLNENKSKPGDKGLGMKSKKEQPLKYATQVSSLMVKFSLPPPTLPQAQLQFLLHKLFLASRKAF
jgi:hypothetical protein